MFTTLFANLAAIFLAVLAWNALHHWVKLLPRPARMACFGAIMAAATLFTMTIAVPVSRGVQMDLRLPTIALASWFGGPIAAIVAATAAVAYRLAIGGNGAFMGSIGISSTAAIGVALHFAFSPSRRGYISGIILGFAVTDIFLVTSLTLPDDIRAVVLGAPGWLFMFVTFLTIVAGTTILQSGQRLAEERELLRAALRHSPDYVYVKNIDLRFVSVNTNVAAFHGLDGPSAAYGLSDGDLDPDRDHARELAVDERAILQGAEELVDKVELLPTSDGTRWFVTSKSRVHDLDGKVIGLVGVTRDVTAERELHAELTESRNQLAMILKEMSDGVAIFGRDGTLKFCNDQYWHMFSKTAAIRIPGAKLEDILRASAESGEQVGIPANIIPSWIEQVVDGLGVDGEQVVELYDGRWLRVRTRPIHEHDSLIHVTDITNDKVAQKTLLNLAEQLNTLARTDPLTGIANRRALDVKLDEEVARSQRNGQPLSLLMIDVDRFKDYNDALGHQRGDRCLKALALCISSVGRRPSDLAARFGGEEFALVLPETDEDGAFQIAENMRDVIRKAELSHPSSPSGKITVSIGIGSYAMGDSPRSSNELIQKADTALYQAKAAGRDRVMGWRMKYDAGGRRVG